MKLAFLKKNPAVRKEIFVSFYKDKERIIIKGKFCMERRMKHPLQESMTLNPSTFHVESKVKDPL